MFCKRRFGRLLGSVVLFGIWGGHPAFGAGWKILPGHVPRELATLQANGRLAPTNQLRLAIGLPLRDPAGLDEFLAQLYDPTSPNYRHFLTPAEFTARFGPTAADYAAVEAFAQTNGLTIAAPHANRLLLDVAGPAAAVEKAFHIALLTYRHPTEARQCFAPDTEPTVDASLPVADVEGLSDFYRPHPKFRKMNPANFRPSTGSAPDGSGGYFGDDFRNAYAPGVTLTGAGQMVGVLEFDGFYASDIAAYAAAAGGGRTNIVIQKVLLDGYNGVPTTGYSSGNDEVSLDIEMAMAMAPGLSKIVVFEAGPHGLQNDVLNSMLTFSGTVKQLSSSWGWAGGPSTTTDNLFKNMQAVGQSFFNASGDSDAFTTGANSVNGVDNTSLGNAPSSSPYITQVGGTTLTMNGAGAAYGSETVWNWGLTDPANYDGSGSSGGISSYYAMPSWQTNVSDMAGRGGSAGARNIPDVALTADNVYVAYGSGASEILGGTSCAAPLWAGFLALVNQQVAANGNPAVGFINPAIYALAAGPGYPACFHDVTTGNNTWSSSPNLFYAQSGYDLCTGLGTPNGMNLISALAGAGDALGISPTSGFAASGPTSGPFSPDAAAFQLTNNSAAALNWSLINTSAWLTASATGGTLAGRAATSVNVSLAAAANGLAVGNYSTTVTFSNQTSQAGQLLQFTLQVYEPLAVTPEKGFAAAGPVGGPFTSAAQSLLLTNLGNSPVNWSLVNTSAWLNASPAGGSLAAGGQTTVTAVLSSAASSLPAAVYAANLLFTHPSGVAAVVPFELLIGQPIIQNGGFETGDFTGWTQSGNAGSTLVTGSSSDYVHSGSFGAALGPVGSLGYLTQSLTTSAGQTYLLSLWLRNATGGTPNQIQVQWDGVTLLSQTNFTVTAWTNLQFLVTASSSITPLQLGFRDDPNYLGLDDVNVTPVAPPVFKSTARSEGNFLLAWNATTGVSYQVQYKTNLLQAGWINLGNATTAQTDLLTLTDTNAFQLSLQRFYRLLMLP